jgi:hypothetical protein
MLSLAGHVLRVVAAAPLVPLVWLTVKGCELELRRTQLATAMRAFRKYGLYEAVDGGDIVLVQQSRSRGGIVFAGTRELVPLERYRALVVPSEMV